MAEVAANSQPLRDGVLDALDTLLQRISAPSLTVQCGLPWSIDVSRLCCYWYIGRATDPRWGRSLGDRSLDEKFLIHVYWLPPQSPQQNAAMVAEAWNVDVAIQQVLAADVTLGGIVQDCEIQASTAGLWQHFSGATYYALQIEIWLAVTGADLEGRSV